MLRIHYIIVTILAFFILKTPNIFAENNQIFVIDVGIGYHLLHEADDITGQNTVLSNSSFFTQSAVEFYLFGNIGFGYKEFNISGSNIKIEAFSGDKTVKSYSVRNRIFTLNLVPIGGTGYARMVFVIGSGTSQYDTVETFEDSDDSSKDFKTSGSSNGTVILGQVFGDWGGDGLGFRAGFSSLSTKFEKLVMNGKTYDVDASGYGLCFINIRYAF